MTYRQPSFLIDTTNSALPAASIVARNASTLSNATKRALVDGRQLPLGSFVATGANAGFQFDLGASGIGSIWNRIVIPAGHGFDGETLEIVAGTSSGIPSPSSRGTKVISGNGVIDWILSGTGGNRYWALQVQGSSAAEVFEIGEIAYGTRSVFSSSVAVDPGWSDDYVVEQTRQDFAGRTSSVVMSPPRRRFSLRARNIEFGTQDWDVARLVITSGQLRPFWFYPLDDSESPVLVAMASEPTLRQEFPAPKVSQRFELRLEMIEQLT